MGSEADNEIPDFPDTGAIFTFGASGFADNLPSHFFIRNDPIIDLACGEEHTMVVCRNGRLFGFGGNEFGQVGLGHKNTVIKPSCVKSLKPEKIRLVACGKRHTIACTECNKVFAWGDDDEGQVGIGENEAGEDTFLPKRCDEKVEFKSYIKQLAAGSVHSAALTNDGSVYVWGSNQQGQLGLGDGIKKMRSPSLLPLKDNIVQIACGLYHTLLLSERGQIFVFGEGDGGKLGLGGNSSVPLPIPLSFDDLSCRVIGISAGGQHSMALTEDGDVYAWGENQHQQLGFPQEEYSQINRPTVVSFLRNVDVKQITCGHHHTAFITDKNELYMCGDTHNGKLCGEIEFEASSPKIRSTIPFKVSKFKGFKVEKVACGGKQTMVLASPEKYTDTVIPNGFSKHMVVSSTDHQNGKGFSNSTLELPSHREIISPPPARTSQSSLTIPITNNIDETSTEQIDHSSNIPPEHSIPPPKNISSRTPSPNNFLNHTQTLDNTKNNELKNNLEITEVVSDDSAVSSSNTDETVSTKFISYNNCIDDCSGLEKNDSPRINRLNNNFFEENLPFRVVYQNKQIHHKFCYSMNLKNTNEENAEKNSFNNYYCYNKNINEVKDETHESNDFDDESDDYDDEDEDEDTDYDDDDDIETSSTKNDDRKNFTNNYSTNEKYHRYRGNQFHGIDTTEEIQEDRDFDEKSQSEINKTNVRFRCSNFRNDLDNFELNELDKSIKQYLLNNSDSTFSTVPRIFCFYEKNTPDYPKFECKNQMNTSGFDKEKQTELEQEIRRKIIEHWLKENQNEGRREDKTKCKQSKLRVYDIKLRCDDKDDVFNRGFGKGGGISKRKEMDLQRNGSFFQFRTLRGKISKTNRIDSPSERDTNLNSSESFERNIENEIPSPKGKSDNMLMRIFGSKKGIRSGSTELNEIENGSSNSDQDEAISKSNEEGGVSPNKRRNHTHNNSGARSNGNTRGHQKNSKMCALL